MLTFSVTSGSPEQPLAVRDMPSQPRRALVASKKRSLVPTLAQNGRGAAGVQFPTHDAPCALPMPAFGAHGPYCATTEKPENRSDASHMRR